MASTTFDVSALVRDLGGPANVAAITGKPRTAPYRWIEQGFINTRVLEAIKGARPDINLDGYFIANDNSPGEGA